MLNRTSGVKYNLLMPNENIEKTLLREILFIFFFFKYEIVYQNIFTFIFMQLHIQENDILILLTLNWFALTF